LTIDFTLLGESSSVCRVLRCLLSRPVWPSSQAELVGDEL
jgi:hypothetical protein